MGMLKSETWSKSSFLIMFYPYSICIDCGEPPSIDDADADRSNGIGIHSTATYGCKEGLFPLGGSNKTNCLSNGTWSASTFQCESQGASYSSFHFTGYCSQSFAICSFPARNDIYALLYISFTSYFDP